MDASTKTKPVPPAMLQEAPLRELIAANVVSGLTAVGGLGGFVVQASFAGGTAVLSSSRGEPRTFASLSALASLMKRLGAPRFDVDATHYAPGRVRQPRPERSAAMKAGRLPRGSKSTTASSTEGTKKK